MLHPRPTEPESLGPLPKQAPPMVLMYTAVGDIQIRLKNPAGGFLPVLTKGYPSVPIGVFPREVSEFRGVQGARDHHMAPI